MSDDRFCLIVDARGHELHPRPRLEGSDSRRPGTSRVSYQDRLVRAFQQRDAHDPIRRCAVSVDVHDDGRVPAVATLKSTLDALESAGVVADDRFVVAARLTKYRLRGGASPTANVEVLPRPAGTDAFIRSSEQHSHRKVARAVTASVPYLDQSGVPGSTTFSSRWAADPEEYEALLRIQWQLLVREGAVRMTGELTTSPLSGRLIVHLPVRTNADGNNLMLYVLDMLELARRDSTASQSEGLSIDEMLAEVAFLRDLDSGFYLTIETVGRIDQYSAVPYYLRSTSERIDPFDPNSS